MKKNSIFHPEKQIIAFLGIILLSLCQIVSAQKPDISQLKSMKARSIGPA